MVQQVDTEKNPVIPNTVVQGARDHLDDCLNFDENGRHALTFNTWWLNHIGGVEIIQRKTLEIAEARNASLINFFPNTEFIMCRNPSQHTGKPVDTILMFVGESWCYGGNIRDMQVGYPSGESVDSFRHALTTTVGAKLSEQMNCDLHQSCWPGDQTSNMFVKAEQMLDRHVSEGHYKKFRVAIQITDSHRDEGLCNVYEPNNHVRRLVEAGNVGMTTSEWLAAYDRGFLQWADRMKAKYPHHDVEILVWKNFNPWNITDEERKQFVCKTVDPCWSHFSADLDGYPLYPTQELNNANQCDPTPRINISMCTAKNTDQQWREHQLECINRLFDYIQEVARNRGDIFDGYPTALGHRLWSVQLCKAGGWFYDPENA